MADAAREELEGALKRGQRTLEMQWSFNSNQNGKLRRRPGYKRYPACYELMRAAEEAFGIQNCSADRAQVKVRQYRPPQELYLHVDSVEMFTSPVLFVFLRCDGPGDGLVLRRPDHTRPEQGEAFKVTEAPGVAVCLEGPARYDFGHEVPPVTAPRLSLTWRFYHEEYLQPVLDDLRRRSLAR